MEKEKEATRGSPLFVPVTLRDGVPRVRGVSYASALNHPHQHQHDRDHQQQVNETAECVRTHHPEQPENHENDEQRRQHVTPSFRDGEYLSITTGGIAWFMPDTRQRVDPRDIGTR
jgi:hypothetical protein